MKDPAKVRQHELYLAQDNMSNDSLDMDQNLDYMTQVSDFDVYTGSTPPQPWLIEQLVTLITKDTTLVHSGQSSSPLVTNDFITYLKDELIDLLQSDYFQDALFEQFQQSFDLVIKDWAVTQIFSAEANPTSLKLAGINTHLYKLLTDTQ